MVKLGWVSRQALVCLLCMVWGCDSNAKDEPRGGGQGSGGAFGTGGAGGGGQGLNGTGAQLGGTGSVMLQDEQACATANIRTSRSTPTIYFLVDGSGSMCAGFNGPTRWQALRTALLDPMAGVIYQLQSAAEFGMVLYDGTVDLLLAQAATGGTATPACALQAASNRTAGECPQVIEVPAVLNNAGAIDGAWPQMELGGSTPTDRALSTLVDRLVAAQVNGPDTDMNPQYIVMATDGAPNDICVGGIGGDGVAQQQGVLTAVDRAAAANIKTFVISLAGGDQGLQAHLDQVADRGDVGNPDAHTFNPETPADLVADIIGIVGGAVGCNIFLEGKVTRGSECTGAVKLNGNAAPCCMGDGAGGMSCNGAPTGNPDGWRLKEDNIIELVGATCVNFLAADDLSLEATFPCSVYVE